MQLIELTIQAWPMGYFHHVLMVLYLSLASTKAFSVLGSVALWPALPKKR